MYTTVIEDNWSMEWSVTSNEESATTLENAFHDHDQGCMEELVS